MIRVFASITDEKPEERHEWSGTLMEWLANNVGDIDPSQPQPIGVTLNGKILPPQDWEREVIHSDDVVDVTVQPRGVQLLVSGLSLRETFRPIVNALIPDIPKQPSAGRAFRPADARANIARLGQVVPECLGSYRRFPDYLVPPHRWFTSTRTQRIQMLLCIGQGEYNLPISGVKVGDTPITALGVDAEYEVYPPNADLSAESAAEWWHNCGEVGATSTGGAGIALGGVTNVSDYPSSSAFTFSADSITIPAGAGSFPEGWNNTLTVRVEQYLDYEIVTGGTRDIIRGPLDQLGAFAGMKIEIDGDNAGLYTVETFTASVPDAAGSASTLTGNAAPARFDFDVTSATFSVTLDGNSQSITLNTDVTDLSGLITELNSQLDATIQAQDDGTGKVQLVEQGPNYSGTAITVSGDYTDVLGASPVGFTGDETTVAAEAEMTLSYDSGDPVTGFTPNAARMAIGYRGMRYLVDGATTSAIELTRLDDEGSADVSWPGFDNVTLTDAVVYVTGTSAETGWAGPFTACPEGETTDRLSIDLFFPKGLYYQKKSGSIRSNAQSVSVRWREAGTADSWTTEVFSFSAGTTDQIGFTRYIELPSGIRPEVSVRKHVFGIPRYVSDVEWYGLRAKIDAPTSYPWTTIAVKLKNSNKLASQSENQINVIAERKLPVLSGGAWTGTNEVTRDIVPAVRYIAESVGMPQDTADMVALDTLYKSRGDTFDFVFDETTVRDALKTVLRTGMAELTIEDGTIKPVRDGERTEFEQGFSPQNMIGGLSRSFSSHRPDDPDGVDVEFTNRDTWASETVECRLPGDLGNKVEKIKLEGVTDRTQAWRIGMRRRRAIKYRRWEYRFDTELEGLNAGYMSYVPLLADQEGYGQSSHMVSISDAGGGNALVVVTEDMDWSGTGHVVAFRNENGEVVGPFSATIGANDKQIIAAIPPGDWPDLSKRQEPPHVYFGTSEKWHFPALIQAVEPSGPLQVGIRAVNYDERVYADDDNSPPS